MAPTKARDQQGTLPQAFLLALQHPAAAASQRNICTLLQVSKTVRAAIQQSVRRMTDISFRSSMWDEQWPRVWRFAAWLQKYPLCIRSIAISGISPQQQFYHTRSEFEFISRAEQEISKALAAAVDAATSSAATQQGGGIPLGWSSFRSDLCITEDVMEALAAAPLRCLEAETFPEDAASWGLALRRLSGLQHLVMRVSEPNGVPGYDICRIGLLQQLTSLTVNNLVPAAPLQQLPIQLQQLRLDFITFLGPPNGVILNLQHLVHLQRLEVSAANIAQQSVFPTQLQQLKLVYVANDEEGVGAGVLLNLQHLVKLQQLDLKVGKLASGCVLPAELQCLTVVCDAFLDEPPIEVLSITALTKLRTLSLGDAAAEGEGLQSLAALPHLQHMSLRCNLVDDMAATLDAWQHLPQLHELGLSADELGWVGWQQTLHALSQVTQLTKLSIRIDSIIDCDPEGYKHACEAVGTLTRLQELSLAVDDADNFDPKKPEVESLTALTALTKLVFTGKKGPFIDTLSLCLLASRLTNLEWLHVEENMISQYPDYAIDSLACALPLIGRLTRLRHLHFTLSQAHPFSLADRCLPWLTGLTRLTELSGFHRASAEVLESFWAAVQAQRQLDGSVDGSM